MRLCVVIVSSSSVHFVVVVFLLFSVLFYYYECTCLILFFLFLDYDFFFDVFGIFPESFLKGGFAGGFPFVVTIIYRRVGVTNDRVRKHFRLILTNLALKVQSEDKGTQIVIGSI